MSKFIMSQSNKLKDLPKERGNDILQYLLKRNPQIDFEHLDQYVLISKKKMNDLKQRIKSKEGR